MLGQLVVTVEQISTSLAHVFNIILHEGNVHLNSNKQGSVSLTSMTCKLLGKQKLVAFLIKHKLINSSRHGFLNARHHG